MKIDDPVGAHAIHGVGGVWGVIAVGLFAESVPLSETYARAGLFMGGGWYLLGVQTLAAVCLTIWGMVSTCLLLFLVDKITPIRMSEEHELLGADISEHNVRPIPCNCCCNNKMESMNVQTTLNEVARKRESQFTKAGQDNHGYQGKFTLKNLDFTRSRNTTNNHDQEAA